MDSEVLVDEYTEIDAGGRLWSDTSLRKFVANPAAREIALLANGLSDRIILAYGNQIKIFRRLKFIDVLYLQLVFLDRAFGSMNEKSSKAINIAKWDLILFILKVGLDNFCAGLIGIIIALKDGQLAKGSALIDIYTPILTQYGIDAHFDNIYNVTTLSSVRKLSAAILQELEIVNPQTFNKFVISSQPGTVVLSYQELLLSREL
jgi:hypothetical protein